MTHRVSNYQLPPGQLWWILRFQDGGRVSETLFTYEGERRQTWFFAQQYALILLREMGLENTKAQVSVYGKASLLS